jgi:hypothetical protein
MEPIYAQGTPLAAYLEGVSTYPVRNILVEPDLAQASSHTLC